MAAEAYLYLPDECWECVFKFLNNHEDDKDNSYFKYLSLVSKQFLSITNRLRFFVVIGSKTLPFIHLLFQRFPNITSLALKRGFHRNSNAFRGDRNAFLHQISRLPLKLTCLDLTSQVFIPADGLRLLIADCFPSLEEVDIGRIAIFHDQNRFIDGIKTLSLALSKLRKINLSTHSYMTDECLFHLFNNCKFLEEVIIFDCFNITNVGIVYALCERPKFKSLHFTNRTDNCSNLLDILRNCPSLILKRCCKIRHLNLAHCSKVKLLGMNFEAPKLEVLNLSHTNVNNAELLVISKSCPRLLQLTLENCIYVSNTGVKHVAENCIQLREINLKHCQKVHPKVVDSLIFSRPTLRKIIVPPRYRFNDGNRELLSHGCLLC
ncbi:uncharacterized protein LOC131601852 [Vicia villosa]|uniref:uncharacterized protein LOC131601852 n=1 Tax=Vicia villosa TaxID=3911 RepID=UPI00273B3EA3|nr:uncharacterized protein LOC131601852 [Vicia villosa]